MTAAPSVSVCSCGELVTTPAGLDERGMPLCWQCTMQREMEAAQDWPPQPANAFRGCVVGMTFAGMFWCTLALICAALLRG